MTTLSVIIPFLNEGGNIDQLTHKLNKFIPRLKDLAAEVIFVDDGSTDDSVAKLKKTSFKFPAKIIKLSKNFGSHAALRAGILHASSDLVTFVYADLQDPLSLIPRLATSCLNGFDITWAVRRKTKSGSFEKLFSSIYSKLMIKYVSPEYPKRGFDVVMFNRKVANELNDNIESNSSIFLQLLISGFKQKYIYYNKKVRVSGKSKWTLSKKIKLLIDSFVGFSYSPLRFISTLGISLSLIGFVWSFYIGLRAIIARDLTPGWPSLIAILLIGFGFTNISLGIIAEYLWRTLDASRHRKVFIIDTITKLKQI